MAVGSSARCFACRTPHRPEVDRRLLAGESSRNVSKWLADQGEQISHTAISRHQREHLSISEEIAERARASLGDLEQAVKAGVSRVEALQQNADKMAALRDKAIAAVEAQFDRGKISGPLVTLVTGCASEVRQSTQAVMKALGEEVDPAGAEAPHDYSHLTNEELEVAIQLATRVSGRREGSAG